MRAEFTLTKLNKCGIIDVLKEVTLAVKNRFFAWLFVGALMASLSGCRHELPDNSTSPTPAPSNAQETFSQEIPQAGEDTPEPSPIKTSGSTYLDELKFDQKYLASLKYAGDPYITINDNCPYFTEGEKECLDAFEMFAVLDGLGRCGTCYANICEELMPTEERGEIGMVKPTGWHTVRYDHVDGKYLYNRCHLIGFQLTGENANAQNLITGTRYMNVQRMLPYENQVADYVHETGNHVLYRVTPIFDGDDLVARGVLMEAYSVEDDGKGIQFNVFCHNAQPGVGINYATGESWADETVQSNTNNGITTNTAAEGGGKGILYVLNTRSKKVHLPACSSVSTIADHNKAEVMICDIQADLIGAGYEPCGQCDPF